jgi:hypothetical protein
VLPGLVEVLVACDLFHIDIIILLDLLINSSQLTWRLLSRLLQHRVSIVKSGTFGYQFWCLSSRRPLNCTRLHTFDFYAAKLISC